jgi:hypothetical protein
MRIDSTEQELLRPEIISFARVLKDPAARSRYESLQTAVAEGEVPEEQLGHLGNVLEVSLQSGRVRKLYGADGEQALARLFHRTPAGARMAEAAKAVTEALAALEGQIIAGIKISAAGPGSYRLAIDTDRCEINIRLDRSGVDVENLAIGM